ncbi:MAG TPA: RnfABCDGE type electron transport complex subunit B [Firmicutes bacterium]|nr:RnfABCDGE type electron transport complex subunit B [Candidatus Fermentithermobacillaceae bacterium]
MVSAIVSLGLSGLVIGLLLAVAAQKFKVETDPKVTEIISVLPGANCGGCGFPGCAALAEAISEGKAPVNACVVGGKNVADLVAKIMGVAAGDVEPSVAVVYCQGNCDNAVIAAEYQGVEDCHALHALGGTKKCSYSCLGLGSCVKACVFDAIHMGEDGIPVVDREKCTGCGACAKACPRGIIELVPASKKVHILCRSYDKGPVTRKNCKVGCIACQACVRSCPQKTIFMDRGTLAKIDYTNCDNCGICVTKCPVKTIKSYEEKTEVAAS